MSGLIKFDYVNQFGNFSAVLSHYGLDFTTRGSQLRVLCPFHNDTDPSLSVTTVDTDDAQANTFHCFGCKESGSIIDFVALMENTDDLRAAARQVASISGCDLAPGRARGPRPRAAAIKSGGNRRKKRSEQSGDGRSEVSTDDETRKAGNGSDGSNSDDLSICDPNPPLKFALRLDASHPYVVERVGSQALIEHFGIGYLPETSKSMMANRLCIPIENDDGEIIAYAGRHPSDTVPDGTEKYLFPPKFKKHSALFNLHRLIDTDVAFLLEGFFGTVRLHAMHVPVVSMMGTSMSREQVELLRRRGIKRVVVMLDGDEAGEKALPALILLLTRWFFVQVLYLPDGEAPDTVSEKVLRGLVEPFVR